MERWKFGIDNNKLIDLVLKGRKKATCSIYDGNKTIVGEESVLLDDFDEEVCKVKSVDVIIIKFKDVTWKLASLEGEFDNLNEWKRNHLDFFKKENINFNQDKEIEFEIFEVIEKYK